MSTARTLALTFEDKIEIGNTGFALTPGFRFDWFNYNPSTGGGFADQHRRLPVSVRSA